MAERASSWFERSLGTSVSLLGLLSTLSLHCGLLITCSTARGSPQAVRVREPSVVSPIELPTGSGHQCSSVIPPLPRDAARHPLNCQDSYALSPLMAHGSSHIPSSVASLALHRLPLMR